MFFVYSLQCCGSSSFIGIEKIVRSPVARGHGQSWLDHLWVDSLVGGHAQPSLVNVSFAGANITAWSLTCIHILNVLLLAEIFVLLVVPGGVSSANDNALETGRVTDGSVQLLCIRQWSRHSTHDLALGPLLLEFRGHLWVLQ